LKEYDPDTNQQEFYGEGRYATVKKCIRKSDKALFAVKEARSMIEDDYHRSILESDIL